MTSVHRTGYIHTMKTFKVASSRIENETEICNTCVRPANSPYRYTRTNAYGKPKTRGCIASCHDVHVRYSTDASWVAKKRYRLPKWITDARNAMLLFERVSID